MVYVFSRGWEMDSVLWCYISPAFSSCIPVTAVPMAKILSFRGKIPIASLLEIFSRKCWILNHANGLSMKVMKLEKNGSGGHCLQPSLLCSVLCWWAVDWLVLTRAPYSGVHFLLNERYKYNHSDAESFNWFSEFQIFSEKICRYFIFKNDMIEWMLHAPLAYNFIWMPLCIHQSGRCIYELKLLKIQFLLEHFITYVLNLK